MTSNTDDRTNCESAAWRPERSWPFCAIPACVRRRLGAGEPKWKQHTINGKSEFEAAGVFDVDNDGKLDIVSGDTWYQGPDWKPHHVRDVTRQGHLLQLLRHPAAGRQRRRQDRLRHLLATSARTSAGSRTRASRARPGPITRSTCRAPSEAAVAGRPHRRRHARHPAQHGQRRRLVRAGKKADGQGSTGRSTTSARRPPATASARATSTATAASTC